jgi:endonuclease/exonuclease/phosphatase family metal-dependent hydrolase
MMLVRVGAVLAALSVALLALGPAAYAEPRPVKVMTRNLYLGADLNPVFTAPTVQQLLVRAAVAFQKVQANDFPARAKALAREIKDADPDLIGLQEVSLWRQGPIAASPATTVVYDYLSILQAELAAHGLNYAVLVEQFTSDGELPTALGVDVRLTQRNVILGKSGLPADEFVVSKTASAIYLKNFSIPTLGGTVTDWRGWTAVDATVNKRTVRFINTHLDSTVAQIRVAQAAELLAGPANTSLPVVLVGDLNSPPTEMVSSAYALLTGAGFVDAWTKANPSNVVLTCCHSELLLNPVPAFTERIDYVLTRPAVSVTEARIVGTDSDNRTASGLWPSDHAGVVATLVP